MTFGDCFAYGLFFGTITGRRKHKLKHTRETQLSENSRVDKKIAKKCVVHRMVMPSLGIKTRGDVYGSVKNHQ